MKRFAKHTEVEEMRIAERGLRNIKSAVASGARRERMINLPLTGDRGSLVPQSAIRNPQLNLCPQKHSSRLSMF
jgi:hypothetical protein